MFQAHNVKPRVLPNDLRKFSFEDYCGISFNVICRYSTFVVSFMKEEEKNCKTQVQSYDFRDKPIAVGYFYSSKLMDS